MRSLTRLVAAAALVAAGGLTLPGGAAQAAACSGTTGVTVVIDYGATSSTLCAPGDPSSAMSALKSVATVVSPQRYPGTVVCRINGTPANDPCIQMPPASAYWAFFHAPRGGSWTYSQSGVASYNPAPGTVLGFAFGSGGKPDTAPPAKTAPPASSTPKPSASSTPRPSTRPSASSSPRSSAKPSAKPKASSTGAAATPRSSSSSSPRGTNSTTGTAPTTQGGSASKSLPGKAVPSSGSTTTAVPGATTTTSGTTVTTPGSTTGSGEQTASDTVAAGSDATGSGSPTTLFAGIGLVGAVGAAAAYLTHRRRHTHG